MKRLTELSEGFRVSRRFWPQVVEHRGRLLLVGAITLLAVACEILRPWPVQWIFDGALVPGPGVVHPAAFYVWTGALALLGIVILKTGLEYFGTLELTAVGHSVTRSLRLRIFKHLTDLSPRFHARHKSGDLLVRLMGDVPMVRTMLVDSSVHITTRTIQVVATVVVMLVVDPLLTAFLLLLLPILALVVWLLSTRLTIAVRKQRRKEGELADFLHEAIGATTLIQSLGRSEHTVRRFARSNRRSARAGLKAARVGARLSASVELLLAVLFAACLGLGGFRVVGGHMSPGELIVFLSYVRGISKPIRSAAKHQAKVAKGTACGERILHVLDEVQEIRGANGELVAPLDPRVLTFEGVRFVYEGESEALRGVDLELRRGELTALVGPSGAGKSTLTSLALRIFDPDQGSVKLDGVDLRKLDVDTLRERFGLSMQDAILFGETIRENLLLGRPDADDAQMLCALEAAGAFGFVSRLPGGLGEVLGSGGAGLSGGEARRLCFARALLRESPILIVDEPFAGLDRETAECVARALERYARDHIALAITHDVERLEAFDRVLFLDGGRLLGDGPHDLLLETCPRYAEICGLGDPVS